MRSPTLSFYFVILAISLFGFLNGCAAGWIFRRRWWMCGAAGAAVSYAAEEMYSWYRLGYADAAFPAADFFGYAACGWIAANAFAVLFLSPLALLSFWRRAREFCRAAGVCVLAAAAVFGIYGVTLGWSASEIVTVDVEIGNLPPAFENFRVAQLSDTHLGPYYRAEELARDVRRAADAEADFLAITGDLIDDNRFMGEVSGILKEETKKIPEGAVFIWGNHEYYHTMRTVREGLAAAGVPLLENSSLAVTREGETLYFAGVDYPWSRDRAEEISDMAEAALAGVPRKAPVILLAHHPDFIREGFKRGVPLTLAGHTHGMQLGFFGKALWSPYEYTRGLYSNRENKGYVCRGAGGWFPFRAGCEKEITIFVLHGKGNGISS